MSTLAASPTARPTTAVARVAALARANAVLMVRNRLTMFYGLVLPLLPMALLLAGDRGDTGVGAQTITSVAMSALLFPVFYNILSLVVTRRDELVLKRLRTGETRDRELLVSLCVPGVVVAIVVGLLAVPVAMALGQDFPLNPVLYVAMLLVGCLLFAALALWTAAWTRNAEAAQLTSMPVIFLAVLGTLQATLPERFATIVERTPTAALDTLVRVTWFGEGTDGPVSFAETWAASAEPVAVMLAWTALALWLAQRSMRWEPRS